MNFFNFSKILRIFIILTITYVFYPHYIFSQDDKIPIQSGLYNYDGLISFRVFQISPRLADLWDLEYQYIQTFYYNKNMEKDVPTDNFIQAYTIIKNENDISPFKLVFLDNGNCFDNEANDGVYGAYLTGDFADFKTDVIDIYAEYDTLSIKRTFYCFPVKSTPNVPHIINPLHQSTINTSYINIQIIPDHIADGCEVVLAKQPLNLGEQIHDIVYRKTYSGPFNKAIIDSLPVTLQNNQTYNLIVWNYFYTNKTQKAGESYSMEYASFTVDTTITTSTHFSLKQNYPNPFQSSTIITWDQKQEGWTSLTIYNILGKKVKQLANTYFKPGRNFVIWDGTNDNGQRVSSGTFFLQSTHNSQNEFIKINYIQ